MTAVLYWLGLAFVAIGSFMTGRWYERRKAAQDEWPQGEWLCQEHFEEKYGKATSAQRSGS